MKSRHSAWRHPAVLVAFVLALGLGAGQPVSALANTAEHAERDQQRAPRRASSGDPSNQSPSAAGQTPSFPVEIAPDGREMRAGGLLVKFRDTASSTTRAASHSLAGARSATRIGPTHLYQVQVDSGTSSQALGTYRSQSNVEWAQPDYVVRAFFSPNDPFYAANSQWGLTKVNAAGAWDTTQGAYSTRIAILDCGILSTHADIVGKVVATVDYSGSPYGATDKCGHGTHVAGIAAATTNNGGGVAGLGFTVSLMNGKVLDDSGSGTIATVLNGIYWAADNGARVINMSLGGGSACSSAEQAAVNYAWARGVVIVAAAGNSGASTSSSPASCTHVISVAATNISDAKPSWSNYGTNVDVAAPGDEILSTYFNGGYTTISGTSMASPFVAGLAALLWSTPYASSNLSIENRILQTADHITGTGAYWTYGRINAAAAVAYVPPAIVPAPSGRGGAPSGSPSTTSSSRAGASASGSPSSPSPPNRR
ncbi:MAG: S8 family serine peptidase [Chloroflexota bacterium]